jgi:hypothetical protein
MAFVRAGAGGERLQIGENAIHGLFNAGSLCQETMTMFKFFMLILAACVAVAPVAAQKARRAEQDKVLKDTRDGDVRSLRNIEDRVVPGMKARGAAYIGAEYEGQIARYRLKFMRGQSVIWVDVDGRSGNIIGKAGE